MGPIVSRRRGRRFVVLLALARVALPLIFLGALLIYRHRGPLLITLGLFAMLPMYSGLCHWGGSEQRNQTKAFSISLKFS